MSSNNNRWWENYLVRYLVGNIFAVLVIFYLIGFHGQEIQKSLCTPQSSKIDLCTKQFSSEVYNFIFQTNQKLELPNIALLKEDFKELPDIKKIVSIIVHQGNSTTIKIDTTTISFVSVIILSIFGFSYMYIASIPIFFLHVIRAYFYSLCDTKKPIPNFILNSQPQIFYYFLKKSTEARQEDCSELINSYKHAREHGNAYGIVLMEILFSWYLILFRFSIWALVLWLMLGFSAWFMGILVEFAMIKENEK